MEVWESVPQNTQQNQTEPREARGSQNTQWTFPGLSMGLLGWFQVFLSLEGFVVQGDKVGRTNPKELSLTPPGRNYSPL